MADPIPFDIEKFSNDNGSIKDTSTVLSVQQCAPDFDVFLNKINEINDSPLTCLFPEATDVIKHYLQLPIPLLFMNSRHWLSAEELISQCLQNEKPSRSLKSYSQETLFGRMSITENGHVDVSMGEIEKNNNGLLILNISPLLVEPGLWFLLKSFMQRGHLQANEAVNAQKIKQPLPDFTSNNINTKIILVASRFQLDELIQIDPEYGQVPSLFCELASQLPTTQENVNAIVTYCNTLSKTLSIQIKDNTAFATLLTYLSNQCEHQQQLLFSPELIMQVLMYSNLFSNNNDVSTKDLTAYFSETDRAQSLPRKYSEQSILEGQINLQLTGENIGQINGMSVVELLGYPCQFGEVFRISASDMLGDGEIIDVERKVELAGNIHAKSTLIVQGYLNHFFNDINAFPYSCNLVFEQSYQESDGDSASLAILLAVSSCYAQTPIKQDVFVTGSLDQHGNVLPIGGVNQKIEAVTRLFDLKLIQHPVSIVMPAANKINLTLNPATLSLIKSGYITIHAISHCHQAFPILLDKTFDDILKVINLRIETAAKEEMGETSGGVLSRFLNYIFH